MGHTVESVTHGVGDGQGAIAHGSFSFTGAAGDVSCPDATGDGQRHLLGRHGIVLQYSLILDVGYVSYYYRSLLSRRQLALLCLQKVD